jgi:hypothetical protein
MNNILGPWQKITNCELYSRMSIENKAVVILSIGVKNRWIASIDNYQQLILEEKTPEECLKILDDKLKDLGYILINDENLLTLI